MTTAQSPSFPPEEFETVAEAEVDSRGRVSLGRAGPNPAAATALNAMSMEYCC